MTEDLNNSSLFPILNNVRFSQREHLFQTKKLFLELQVNRLKPEYFFYNMLEIVRDTFPIDYTMTIRIQLNEILAMTGQAPVETDEAFIKELYG